MRAILAIDQGTTGTTALVLGERGEVLGRGYREIPQFYPQPGWVEHDPEAIWASVQAVVPEALAASGLEAGALVGLGLTNQRETFVVWDRATGRPLDRAVVWQCRRSADDCAAWVAQGLEEEVRERTGLVIDAYFSGTKLAHWLQRHPAEAERARRGELCFGTIDTWLVWKLTGGQVHATDVTNASRTLMCHLRTLQWDAKQLAWLGVPQVMLPEIRPSIASFGAVVEGALPGVLPGLPIAAVAGDQHAALFGQACFQPGEAKNTYGTGCFLLMNTGQTPKASRNRLLTTVAWQRAGEAPRYALEGSVFIAGAAVQWLRDGLGLIASAAETEALAASVPDTGGVAFVPAFVGLGAPHWDGHARGLIVGLTRGTGRAHLVRATLEAIAHQSEELLRAMAADAGMPLAALKVDGGATANGLLMQLQADLIGVPVVRRAHAEATAWGAGAMAGLGLGLWASEAEVADLLGTEGSTFLPQLGLVERQARIQRWGRAVARAKAWAAEEDELRG